MSSSEIDQPLSISQSDTLLFFVFLCPFAQYFQISCQCCGIAAYINNPLRLHLKNRFQQFSVAPFPRRIYDDHIRVCLFSSVLFFIIFIVFRKDFFRFPTKTVRFLFRLTVRFLLHHQSQGARFPRRKPVLPSAQETKKLFRYRSTNPKPFHLLLSLHIQAPESIIFRLYRVYLINDKGEI